MRKLYEKDGTQKLLASLLSIVLGLLVGAIVVAIVGFTKSNIGAKGVWDGVRLLLAGIFSTGRNAAGVLTWGYNPQSLGNMLFRATPLVMTGLSVAVAFKTGLFNIGAPGQYLMGHGHLDDRAEHSFRRAARLAAVAAGFPGRYAGRCHLGCHPRCAEGILQYQRSVGLHHDQLAGG